MIDSFSIPCVSLSVEAVRAHTTMWIGVVVVVKYGY